MRTPNAKLGVKHDHAAGSFKLIHVSAFILFIAAIVLSMPHGRAQEKISVITIHAKRYEFAPAEITLKAGQRVKLVFISDDVAHGISVDGLMSDINIRPGKPAVVFITPPKVGDFAGECSRYCGSGHERMKLLIHVVE